jgi:hypothetical protein
MIDYNEMKKKFRPKDGAAGKGAKKKTTGKAAALAIKREYEMKKADLEAAAPPVLRPPCDPAHLRAGPFAGLVHLLQALPPGRSQSDSEHVEAVVPGVLCSA